MADHLGRALSRPLLGRGFIARNGDARGLRGASHISAPVQLPQLKLGCILPAERAQQCPVPCLVPASPSRGPKPPGDILGGRCRVEQK